MYRFILSPYLLKTRSITSKMYTDFVQDMILHSHKSVHILHNLYLQVHMYLCHLSSELIPDWFVWLESECGERCPLRDTHVTAANHLQYITHSVDKERVETPGL